MKCMKTIFNSALHTANQIIFAAYILSCFHAWRLFQTVILFHGSQLKWPIVLYWWILIFSLRFIFVNYDSCEMCEIQFLAKISRFTVFKPQFVINVKEQLFRHNNVTHSFNVLHVIVIDFHVKDRLSCSNDEFIILQ